MRGELFPPEPQLRDEMKLSIFERTMLRVARGACLIGLLTFSVGSARAVFNGQVGSGLIGFAVYVPLLYGLFIVFGRVADSENKDI